MKICVIGAGWFGCHIASQLLDDGYDVQIFEKESNIFANASGNNQNRLHKGFHYPRSKKTIKMSKNGFSLFEKKYPFLTKKIKNNFYSISKLKTTKLNFQKYCEKLKKSELKFKKIYNNNILNDLRLYEGVIKVDEKLILVDESIKYFKKKLKSKIRFNCRIDNICKKEGKFEINNKKFDRVINCSGINLNFHKIKNIKYEYCVIFVYKKINHKKDLSLTIMDGPFFTLYPWNNKNEYGLYSVKHSRLLNCKNLTNLEKKIKFQISKKFLKLKRTIVEKEFKEYYVNFNKNFKFQKNLLSIRVIQENKSDSRICKVYDDKGVITVFPGKIDHIFYAYQKVKNCLKRF